MTNKKIAWVTGGATGIGLACAEKLGHDGYVVIISGRRKHELDRAVQHLSKLGITSSYFQTDVTKEQEVLDTCNKIINTFGKIDVLVCSAGINTPNRFWKSIDNQTISLIIDTNLKGVSFCITSVLPQMREQRQGTIIVISSWSGRYYTSFTGGMYNATKQALSPLIESINDQEGSNGIRASIVCPGEVKTPILKLRTVAPPEADIERMLVPANVAHAVSFIVNLPNNVCINEILLSSTHNRAYTGGIDLRGPNNLNP